MATTDNINDNQAMEKGSYSIKYAPHGLTFDNTATKTECSSYNMALKSTKQAEHELLKHVLRKRSESTSSRQWNATCDDDMYARARADSMSDWYTVSVPDSPATYSTTSGENSIHKSVCKIVISNYSISVSII